ncbi:phytanoyl-CoA dioxygenase family protein [Methylobacter luteus]|uniref:phytanoyl-CoA dioxygenase family protein n=1 Tax=Methylobacter luteus TaxID=415 RepID=UPI0003FC70CE|nr:phytanoyl-CoA dioxygenase family protein [Methylobacter luteus]
MDKVTIAQLKKKFSCDGYVVIPSVFTLDEVNAAKKVLLDAIKLAATLDPDACTMLSPEASEYEILTFLSQARYASPQLSIKLRRRIIEIVGYDVPEMIEASVNLKNVAQQILGLTHFNYKLFLISICLPRSSHISEGLLGWHQDFDGAGKYTVWSPVLKHSSYQSGYLEFIPGIDEHLPHSIKSEHIRDVNTVSSKDLPKSSPVAVSCDLGDVIIWNSLTLHATGANESGIPRYAFLTWIDSD